MDALNLEAWTVAELVRWWSSSGFAQRMSPRSRVRTERRLQKHVVKALGALPCASLDAERLSARLADCAEAGAGPELLNKIRSDLRRCIRAAKATRRWPWEDPTQFVPRFRVPSKAWRTLNPAECRALLHAAKLRHLAMFAVAIYAGLRKGEVFALRVDDVDLVGRKLYVRRSGHRDTTKNGRARVVPICNELERYLARQLRAVKSFGSEYVFPGDDGGQRHVEGKIGRTMRNALTRAGITEHVRFQDLRHTCATLLRRAGADRDLVAAILGHVAHGVTDRYTHFEFTDLLAAANRLELGAPAPLTKETT